jgi:hypothetical protein
MMVSFNVCKGKRTLEVSMSINHVTNILHE